MTFDTEREREDVQYPFPIVGEKTREALDELHARAAIDYDAWKQDFLDWLYFEGKDPTRLKGYAMATIHQTHYHIEAAFRWLWVQRGSYTTLFDPEEASQMIGKLGRTQRSETNLGNIKTALSHYFKYQRNNGHPDLEWDCPININEGQVTNRDYIRADEFNPLHEAGLEYKTVKGYNSVTPEERTSIKRHLAQRFQKPMDEIGPADFHRANSFKVPSIISTSLDMGLRPIEIARMKTEWVNLKRGHIAIPREGSSKNEDNWECVLSSKSIRVLDQWLSEREALEKYDGRDELWLNKYANGYDSASLNTIFRNLLDAAGIEPAGRDLSWYSIRHGVATLWADKHDIHQAREQLRHKKVETTLGYVHSSSASRSAVVDSLW